MRAKLTPREPNAYVHKEYPKWVTPAGGKARIVRDATEEAEVMGVAAEAPAEAISVAVPEVPAEEPPAVEETPAIDVTDTDDKDALMAAATALGIKVDGRWSVARLKFEIDAKKGK